MFSPLGKLVCAVVFASAVLAQNLTISLPVAGTTVTAGSNITVELDRPASLSGTQEVSVVIGVSPCSSECPDPSNVLGAVLYSGPFTPQSMTNGSGNAFQNFTVTVPSWYNGPAQLAVARFYLLGAGRSPHLQLVTTAINLDGAVDH